MPEVNQAFELFKIVDAKLDVINKKQDTQSSRLTAIETKMESFALKEDGAANHPKDPQAASDGKTVQVIPKNRKVVVPLSIIAAIAAAVVTILQAI